MDSIMENRFISGKTSIETKGYMADRIAKILISNDSSHQRATYATDLFNVKSYKKNILVRQILTASQGPFNVEVLQGLMVVRG